MARSRSYKAEGIVLRQTPLAEADRILTIYTRELGKVRAVARGVRRPKSKLGGHLEPLCHVAVSLAEGRNLDTVSEAEVIQSFSGLEDDLERLSKGIYLSELVDAFSPDRLANRQVFDLLLDALDRLQCSERLVNLLLSFETKLLGLSGYGPELRQCVECGLDLEAADHLFSSAAGGAVCPSCRASTSGAMTLVPLDAMKVLRFLQREDLAGAEALSIGSVALGQVERTLRAYLRYVLERELKSAHFMDLVAPSRTDPVAGGVSSKTAT